MNTKNELRDKIYSGKRIEKHEAVRLFDWDLIELGYAGNERRKMIYPDEKVGFIQDRIINYTNVCSACCRFCAFHARAGLIEPYELSNDEIIRKAAELVDAGGTQVMLQGGLCPDYGIDKYAEMLQILRKRFPDLYLHSYSPAEIVSLSEHEKMTIDDVIAFLKDAGLNSIPGASDLLVDRMRNKVSPKKLTRDQWCEVMYALKRNGMGSSATMTYGMGETLDERIDHLDTVRMVQDRTGIIRAFIPWSFSPGNTEMNNILPATGVDFLKIVAIARIYLDNIVYIQAGWLTEGLKLAQTALSMGANDMGGVLTEEVVVKATGIETTATKADFIDLIQNAGKVPVLRDSEYNIISEYPV